MEVLRDLIDAFINIGEIVSVEIDRTISICLNQRRWEWQKVLAAKRFSYRLKFLQLVIMAILFFKTEPYFQ